MGRPRSNPEDRFWSKVKKTSDCWIWQAATTLEGYGRFRLPHKHVLAHRYCFELMGNLIPDGFTIHHHCGNKACVNPDHLEVMTLGDNNRQPDHPVGKNMRKTHCCHGHAFTHENTRIDTKGHRVCRTCDRARPRREKAL